MAKMTSKKVAGESEKDELVLTPGGWRLKSKVHLVESENYINGESGGLKITQAKTRRTLKDFGTLKVRGKGISRIETAMKRMAVTGPFTDGWIINSEWTNNTGYPISFFSSRWTVPPVPATDNDQLIYLFNGLQQNSYGPFILQPVLQWGYSPAGGGKYWSITNWYVGGAGGYALHGNLVQVNPGDVVQGIMTLEGQSDGSYDYLSSFIGFPAADLAVKNIEELRWANITLECYQFKALTDYPDTDSTTFSDIEIKIRTDTTTPTDTEANLTWQADDRVTDNGQHCLIVSNNSPGGEVCLCYRNVAPAVRRG